MLAAVPLSVRLRMVLRELSTSTACLLEHSASHFSFLPARDLAACTAVCRVWCKLNRDKASNSLWKGFYTNRWRVTGTAADDVCWQSKYGSKMKQVSIAVEALVHTLLLTRIGVAGAC